MKKMLKNNVTLMLSILFVCALMIPGKTYPHERQNSKELPVPPPNPIHSEQVGSIAGKIGNGNDETPGEWYVGSTPPNLREDAPVLLFVHGLNNTAQVWWENNNMYETAYHNGYQTAFIQLYDAGGASADMWDNGQLLAEKIPKIRNHFNKPITVVAYSKGGVDIQTALVHYDSWRDVENVITLSTPHHGTELANLAYSFWAGWLADLIGARGDGTYVMQTGYMEQFRALTDERAETDQNDYYTIGGTDWGPIFSSTWFGGVYLSSYGANDGVVPVNRSFLPGSPAIAVGSWNHTTVRTGATFSAFQDYLGSGAHPDIVPTLQSQERRETEDAHANQWIYGGELKANQENTIPLTIEDNVKTVSINILTNNELSEFRLINPAGKQLKANVTVAVEQNEYFKEAVHQIVQLDSPEAGIWHLQVRAPQEDAFLLLTHFKAQNELIKQSEVVSEAQSAYKLTVNPKQLDMTSLKATYRILDAKNPQDRAEWTVTGTDALTQKLDLKRANTVYNITVDIEGKTKAGQPFKRTVIDSVYTKK